MGLGGRLRDFGRGGGRDQADRLAAPVAVPDLDRLFTATARGPDSRRRRGRGGGDGLRGHAPVVVRTVARVTEFFRSNLTRGETTPIPVQFLGTVYMSPSESLPWYNTLVWTVAASPVGFLAWALAGSVRAMREHGARFDVAGRDLLGLSACSPGLAAHAGS